jgi:hypothetical protein
MIEIIVVEDDEATQQRIKEVVKKVLLKLAWTLILNYLKLLQRTANYY